MARQRTRSVTLSGSWFLFWEGALIAHFLGLRFALGLCIGFLLVDFGVRIGRAARG